jgi:hypothetical protein
VPCTALTACCRSCRFSPCSARLECQFQQRGTNTLYGANGCRTVVQRPTPICPPGCSVIEQTIFNPAVNRTQVFNKCSCQAGNQPCPARWADCICDAPPSIRNDTQSYVVCSEVQGACISKCSLAQPGTLAPLCPVQLDPLLSANATSPPSYPGQQGFPLWGFSLAAQGQAVAAAVGRRLLRRLLWGRGGEDS